MKEITMNGIIWNVIKVSPNDEKLIDRTGTLTVGTTDPVTKCVYISDAIHGDFEKRVVAHELGHVACFSYGLVKDIHRFCYPRHWIDMEEFICNFVADYGEEIFNLTNDLTKVSNFLTRLVS